MIRYFLTDSTCMPLNIEYLDIHCSETDYEGWTYKTEEEAVKAFREKAEEICGPNTESLSNSNFATLSKLKLFGFIILCFFAFIGFEECARFFKNPEPKPLIAVPRVYDYQSASTYDSNGVGEFE